MRASSASASASRQRSAAKLTRNGVSAKYLRQAPERASNANVLLQGLQANRLGYLSETFMLSDVLEN